MDMSVESNSELPFGSSYCQCAVCGETFRGLKGFDEHVLEKGKRLDRCLTPKEMRAKGWSLNAAGYWVTRIMTEEEKLRARGGRPNKEAGE
jgi:hypothetical protein